MDEFVQAFENVFEKSYGNESGIDRAFRRTLKRDLFVQGLILKWQEKVLPTAENFTEALYQARTAEEQERQLAEIHTSVKLSGHSLVIPKWVPRRRVATTMHRKTRVPATDDNYVVSSAMGLDTSRRTAQ